MTNQDRAKYAVATLKRYEWLYTRCRQLCDNKDIQLEEIFRMEWNVCKDMVELMPSKINRIHYLGYDSPIL